MNRKERRAAQKQGMRGLPGAADDAARLFATASGYHRAGQLSDADALYRQVLVRDPAHAGSLHHLGIIALQIGRPDAAAELIGKAIRADGSNPESHYNIAFALQSLGQIDKALAHYTRALDLKPDYAEAHTNLGNLLAQQGRMDEAAPCYERVIALKPQSAEPHYNLANVLVRQGKTEQAVVHFRQALDLKPDLVEAHNNLAAALMTLGRPDAAMIHHRRALELNPKLVEARMNLGNLLAQQGRLDEALVHYRQAADERPEYAEAHSNLGTALMAQGQLDEAVSRYRQALSINPGFAEATNNLGVALLAQGRLEEAATQFQRAISLRPGSPDAMNNLARTLMAGGQGAQAFAVLRGALAVAEHQDTKTLLVQCLKTLPTPIDGAELRDIVLRALSEPWGRPGDLVALASDLVKQNTAVNEAARHIHPAWPLRLAPVQVAGPNGPDAIFADRLLRELMLSAPIQDIELERLLTTLRLALLDAPLSEQSPSDDALPFWCALATQCFINEYVFALTDAERERAVARRDELIAALISEQPVPTLLPVIVAAYFPLHDLPDAEALLRRAWPEPVRALLTQQVDEQRQEQRLRATIPALTAIDDGVSRLVQAQYEENPYPRWIETAPAVKATTVDTYLRSKFPAVPFRRLGKGNDLDVLVAGCGTGQHAIDVAERFAGARVLAVDLSLTSLSYARRKTEARGLASIAYAQADILGLGSIDRTFDVIESSGVLHHLADPMAGWQVLVSLLRPGGFMAIGLYSRLARQDITTVRNRIAERGIGRTADDIRRYRQDLVADGALMRNLVTSADFYTTSSCRDLLFHAQEHQLTLPEIKAFLAGNALDFIGFDLDAGVLRAFERSHPGGTTDLDLWHRFESEHPHIFSGMYQFWVQKRAAP